MPVSPGEAAFLAGLPRGPKGDLVPGHTTWNNLGPEAKARYARMAAAAVGAMAEDGEVLRAAHIAIEDILVEWRDERLSTMDVGNGFVIRERDGKPSSHIRISTREGLQVGLRAMAEHLGKQCEETR